MKNLEKLLAGGDLRSLGKSKAVISGIKKQSDFDMLFERIFHKDRIAVMRAADIIEKVTINNPQFLSKHKLAIIALSETDMNKELKWHLAQLIPRLALNKTELSKAWSTLTKWVKNKSDSRIVRVNAIQGLFELSKVENDLIKDLKLTLLEVEAENIPSINARIRIIRKQLR